MDQPIDNQRILQNAPSFILSKMVIEDTVDDDKNFAQFSQNQEDKNKFYQMLEEDHKHKEDFMISEEFQNYQQVLVISQIRKDYKTDDPFLTYLEIIAKEIRKQVLIVLKQQDEQEIILKVYYSDINIGFITSSGQIKSTAFIYMNKSQEFLKKIKQILVNFQSHIQSFFQQLQGKHRVVEMNRVSGIALQLHFLEITTQMLIQHEIFQPNLKQSFLRNNRFQCYFMILHKIPTFAKSESLIYVVYKPVDDQIYAIKKCKLKAQPGSIKFENIFQSSQFDRNDYFKINEAKILYKLNHPNVLKLYDWWIELGNDSYYLYMQLDYCSLSGLKYQPNDLLSYAFHYMNRMTNQEKLEKIKDICGQILDGLDYIHKQGIVQKDLKPENIFITNGVHMELIVRLADFTYSRDVKEEKISTPNINSPQKKPQDFDEFEAFGILLLHLILTFPGEPVQRNHYASTFVQTNKIDEMIPLFDKWAVALVRNRNEEFNFIAFKSVLGLAKKLITKKIKDTQEIRLFVNEIQLSQ